MSDAVTQTGVITEQTWNKMTHKVHVTVQLDAAVTTAPPNLKGQKVAVTLGTVAPPVVVDPPAATPVALSGTLTKVVLESSTVIGLVVTAPLPTGFRDKDAQAYVGLTMTAASPGIQSSTGVIESAVISGTSLVLTLRVSTALTQAQADQIAAAHLAATLTLGGGSTPPVVDPPVVTPPSTGAILAAADFNDGTYGGLTNAEAPGHNKIIPDPTGAGRGNVLQISYEGAPGNDGPTADLNQYSEWKPSKKLGKPITHGQVVSFQGDLFFPANTPRFSDTAILRKGLYLRTNAPNNKECGLVFGSGGTNGDLWGISIDGGGITHGVYTYGTYRMKAGVWQRIQYELTMNSAPGKADGRFRLWVDGKLIEDHSGLAFTAAGESTSAGFDWLTIGHQREGGSGDVHISEVRYWDNVVYTDGPVNA